MKKIGLFLLAAVSLMAAPSYALDVKGRFGIGGGYGAAWPARSSEFRENYDTGDIWFGNIKYGILKNTMLVASYSNITVENKNTKHDLTLRPIIMSLRYYAFRHSPINPYITAGAGFSRNTRNFGSGIPEEKWNKFAAQGGVGLEFFITPTASIGAEGLYHHIVATADESPLRLWTAAGTVNFYFGKSDETRDARRDAANAKAEADKAKADAAAALAASQQNTQQAQDEAARQAAAAAAAAAAANAQQTDAQRKMAEMQAQATAAQAEVQNVQDMISRKEMQPVMFRSGSDKLLPESYPALDKVAEVVAKYPNLKLRVEGHTDNVGGDAANLKLSQKRADSVRGYLTSKASSTNVDAVGFGETKPVASNDTAEGRAQNRRVEFLFALPN